MVQFREENGEMLYINIFMQYIYILISLYVQGPFFFFIRASQISLQYPFQPLTFYSLSFVPCK